MAKIYQANPNQYGVFDEVGEVEDGRLCAIRVHLPDFGQAADNFKDVVSYEVGDDGCLYIDALIPTEDEKDLIEVTMAIYNKGEWRKVELVGIT